MLLFPASFSPFQNELNVIRPLTEPQSLQAYLLHVGAETLHMQTSSDSHLLLISVISVTFSIAGSQETAQFTLMQAGSASLFRHFKFSAVFFLHRGYESGFEKEFCKHSSNLRRPQSASTRKFEVDLFVVTTRCFFALQ